MNGWKNVDIRNKCTYHLNQQSIDNQRRKSRFVPKETRGVSYKVYMNYIKAGRGQILFGLFLLFLGIGQVYINVKLSHRTVHIILVTKKRQS